MALSELADKRPPVFAVSGKKNTGKTTLTQTLVRELSHRGLAVAVIKHDGHDLSRMCRERTVTVTKRWGLWNSGVFRKTVLPCKRGNRASGSRFFGYFNDADLILLEGMKDSAYPKIEVMRREVSKRSVCKKETVKAYVTELFTGRNTGI